MTEYNVIPAALDFGEWFGGNAAWQSIANGAFRVAFGCVCRRQTRLFYNCVSCEMTGNIRDDNPVSRYSFRQFLQDIVQAIARFGCLYFKHR